MIRPVTRLTIVEKALEELLVVDSGAKFHGVAPVHALIQFHPESGVLMLRGVSDTRPVKYHLDYLDATVSLYNKDKHVLFQRQNRFSLGKLDFCLHYENLDDEQYTNYLKIRNRALEEADRAVPHPRLLAIPRKPHVKIDDMILHDNIAAGRLGSFAQLSMPTPARQWR